MTVKILNTSVAVVYVVILWIIQRWGIAKNVGVFFIGMNVASGVNQKQNMNAVIAKKKIPNERISEVPAQ